MKRQILPLLICFTQLLYAQVGIGTTTPHESAILDVYSTSKGFLPPRMSKGSMMSIDQPAAGLMVYCTTCCLGGSLAFYDGVEWVITNGGTCTPDLDGDNVADASDVDIDNDGIVDSNEISNIPVFASDLGSEQGTACQRKALTAPDYSNITYRATGNIPDGYYGVVNKSSCGASWATNPGNDHTVDPSGRTGNMIFVNAPPANPSIGYFPVVYGRPINVPKNSELNISLWVVNLSPTATDDPNLTFRFLDAATNKTIDSVMTGAIGSSNWLNYTLSIETKDYTTVKFEVISNWAQQNGGNDFAIDDIEVKVKYGDVDGDGLEDSKDQDADGDGIPDIIEIQNHASIIYPSGNDANNNGLDDAFEPNGISNPVDTDNDGIPDYFDTDSDNDGILDKDETNITLTGSDSDNDGLDNAVDVTNDHTQSAGIYLNNPVYDQNNNGIPDYRE
jgi:hypothetical protein